MEKTERIWLDGVLVPWEEARVHVLTHTLHYGLGVFEGIRCYEGRDGRPAIFRLPEHVERLFGSAHVLDLPMPFGRAEVAQACCEVVRANRLRACYIRPIAFMGEGEMGLGARPPTRVAVAAWPWGAYLGDEGLRHGIRLKTSSFMRFHPNTLLTKAKACGHYVNSIIANREVRAAGYDEALLLDVDGYLADEAFFTGTAAEITPIRELDERRVGDGRPGPVTRRLQALFFAIVRGEEERYRSWLTAV